MNQAGRRVWVFPDAERPPQGDGELRGHESIILLNVHPEAAVVTLTLYFSDGKKPISFEASVKAESVRCLRTDCATDMQGNVVPISEQYSIVLESSIPLVAQYGRLDNRQSNLAYYTTIGYAE